MMKALSATIVIALCLLGLVVPAHCEVVDRIVAIVNDDIITLKELQSFILLERQSRHTSVNEYLQNQKLKEKLDLFIDGVLIKQQAKKLKVDVSDRELDGIIDNIKKQNLITDSELREQLKKENIGYDSFVEGIRMNVLRGRVVSRVISSEVDVSDKVLRAFYDQNKESFHSEEYRLKQIFVSAQKPDAEQRIRKVYGLLEQGKSFEDLAREYSDDPSAKQGGDIGLVKAEDLLPALIEAIQSVEPGSYTKVVVTPYGFHILKLIEVIGAEEVSFESMKDKVRDKFVLFESEKRYQEYIKKLRQASYIEVKI
jgi:peptidyl-prolyl cis-trans isomerase SurA